MKSARASRAVKRHMKSGTLWLFYSYCQEYKMRPLDLDDLVDGIRAIRAKNEIEKIYQEQ